jgi:hypothetical protein
MFENKLYQVCALHSHLCIFFVGPKQLETCQRNKFASPHITFMMVVFEFRRLTGNLKHLKDLMTLLTSQHL